MPTHPRLAERAITLGVTGGIAAYKTADIVRRLRGTGMGVQVVMTRAALELMSANALSTLAQQPVATDLFGGGATIDHIRLSRDADLLLVAPATANILGKVAGGIADDLLSTTIMASSAPVMFAPAMNSRMWANPFVARNVATLREQGYLFVGPASGDLACGEDGPGRMAEPLEIVDAAVRKLLECGEGRRILVTAGPTEESLDAVRVLANRSSGKMGAAIAEAARDRGHRVTLIAGPLRCPAPFGVTRIDVRTTAEMQDAVAEHEAEADVLIMAAAVADYRPRRPDQQKLPSGVESLSLELVPNADILGTVGPQRRVRGAPTIGFALEIGDAGEQRARNKLEEKGLDLIVLNDTSRSDSAFGADTTRIGLIAREGQTQYLPPGPKRTAAEEIIRRAEALCAASQEF